MQTPPLLVGYFPPAPPLLVCSMFLFTCPTCKINTFFAIYVFEELHITCDRVIQASDVVPKKVTVAGCVHDQMGKATFDVDVRGDFDKNRCRQMPPLLAPGLALMASLVAKSV